MKSVWLGVLLKKTKESIEMRSWVPLKKRTELSISLVLLSIELLLKLKSLNLMLEKWFPEKEKTGISICKNLEFIIERLEIVTLLESLEITAVDCMSIKRVFLIKKELFWRENKRILF